MPEIIINLTSRTLFFYKDKSRFSEYPVAIGKPYSPTPTGIWSITGKILNPGGILGSRWMQLSIPAPDGVYGIHGTNRPESIGNAASLGCIRMHNRHVEEIFPLTPVGTRVEIIKKPLGLPPADPIKGTTNYTVKSGDTLWAIARTFGVSLEAIIEANNIKDPNRLTPGIKLIIPSRNLGRKFFRE